MALDANWLLESIRREKVSHSLGKDWASFGLAPYIIADSLVAWAEQDEPRARRAFYEWAAAAVPSNGTAAALIDITANANLRGDAHEAKHVTQLWSLLCELQSSKLSEPVSYTLYGLPDPDGHDLGARQMTLATEVCAQVDPNDPNSTWLQGVWGGRAAAELLMVEAETVLSLEEAADIVAERLRVTYESLAPSTATGGGAGSGTNTGPFVSGTQHTALPPGRARSQRAS